MTQRLIEARKKVEKYNDQIRDKRLKKAEQYRHEHKFKIEEPVWLFAKHKKKGKSTKMLHP